MTRTPNYTRRQWRAVAPRNRRTRSPRSCRAGRTLSAGSWDGIIADWLDNPTRRTYKEWLKDSDGKNYSVDRDVEPWQGSEVGKATTTDILIHAIGKDKDKLDPRAHGDVVRCLEHMKWRSKQDRSRGLYRGKVYYYSPERWTREFDDRKDGEY